MGCNDIAEAAAAAEAAVEQQNMLPSEEKLKLFFKKSRLLQLCFNMGYRNTIATASLSG
jgi:hypothetical protein